MEIKKQNLGPYVVYSLKGCLDHQTIDFVISEITAPRDRRIVIDLEEVTRIDSTGYGSLIKLWKSVTYQGGELHLLCSQAKFLDKLRELNLHKIIHIFQDKAPLSKLEEVKADVQAKLRVSKIENFKMITFEEQIETLKETLQFNEYLIHQINSGNIFIALNFSNVKNIYSDFLSTLLMAKHLIEAKDGWIVFIGIKEELFGIFECTGITQLFTLYPDEKAFVAALRGKSIIRKNDQPSCD